MGKTPIDPKVINVYRFKYCSSMRSILALINSPNSTLQAEGRKLIEEYTVKQLMAEAKRLGIVGYSRLKKHELLDRIVVAATDKEH